MKARFLKHFTTAAVLTALAAVIFTGCKKEEVPTGPVEQVLTPVTSDMLVPGCFYVHSGDFFYQLPAEGCNFDPVNDYLQSTDYSANGMISPEQNRLVSFTWMDDAIPTLYKNDQLVYVAAESIPSFRWERYLDKGYSVGISGLSAASSGKITSNIMTKYAIGSSAETVLTAQGIEAASGFTVDSINGVTLGETYLSDAGIITGMSKNATAQTNVFVGSQPMPLTISADTKFFKSFELYETSRYSLSPDGYAILEVPQYFKSGYYLINNCGFVKFINSDRGMDESAIDLTTPYFYAAEDGKTLTYFEWAEKNGIETGIVSQAKTKEAMDPEAFADKYTLDIDSTQKQIDIVIGYRYNTKEAEEEAARIGSFPKAYLVDTVGNYSQIKQDDALTMSSGNTGGLTYLSATAEGVRPGTWYILFSDFDNITKSISTKVSSGNATTYLHQGDVGEITIFYEESSKPHDFVLTWEKSDRSAKSVTITTPDGLEYSPTKTPGNIMAVEAGRYVIKLPKIIGGDYHILVRGDDLGRVWVSTEESVYFDSQVTEEETAEEEASEEESAEDPASGKE